MSSNNCLKRSSTRFLFGAAGNDISYSNMDAIRSELEAANIKGVDFTTSPNRSYKKWTFASQFIGQAQLIEG